ncbi:MAG: hypothetical protein H6748_03600 [Spirochaetaceae bacterium]|nr:hypothetical protein [Myxococcales bacterium]MCB9723115.1 hypothetical protein [Spirochaetaceae bacterium]
MYKLFVAIALSTSLLMVAASASAQVLVGYQQRIFEKWGDGSGVGGIDVVPCCDVTPMNPTATVDNRVAGQNNGPYFAEHKVRTAMVSNFYGFGTPGALNGDGPAWYGFYNSASGGVTLKQGRFTSIGSLMLVFPGGNLRRLTTMLQRTYFDHAFAPGNGIGTFMYTALGNTATNTPTFRNATTFTPYSSQAGKIAYAPGPNQFGGTRNVFHTQFSAGVDNGSVPGLANRFRFPVKLGPGVPFTPQSVVRRTTGSATFAVVTIPSTMATSGVEQFVGLGTGWFTVGPYTTGMVNVTAATIGTPTEDFTFRTDTGFSSLMQTTMGGVTGVLQLVSGHLLQSRGGQNTNLGGTNMTRITFTPEPASATMLGVGALGLIGLIAHDRRKSRV